MSQTNWPAKLLQRSAADWVDQFVATRAPRRSLYWSKLAGYFGLQLQSNRRLAAQVRDTHLAATSLIEFHSNSEYLPPSSRWELLRIIQTELYNDNSKAKSGAISFIASAGKLRALDSSSK